MVASPRGFDSTDELALGLRANAGQFALLVGVNALVGGTFGQERAVVPLLAGEVFGLAATYSALTFLVAFGAAKALTNLLAGALADRFGRKPPATSWRGLAWRTSLTDPSLSAASQAGFVNNLNDGLAWGLLPIVQSAAGLSIGQIGVLAAAYPATWGLTQIATGALSDRTGRKWLIAAGMLLQSVALASIVAWTGFLPWLLAAVVLGLGTAMVYPTLIAVIADVAPPAARHDRRRLPVLA